MIESLSSSTDMVEFIRFLYTWRFLHNKCR